MTAPTLDDVSRETTYDDDDDVSRETTDSDDVSRETYDPDAPYGRKPNGTPYRMSPEQRAEVGARLSAARAAASGRRSKVKAPRKTTGTARPPRTPDYRPAIVGLLQVPAFALAMMARTNPVLALDSATITLHAPGVAQALQDTADADPKIAQVLERVLAVGPYGALLGALLPIGLQIMANHGRISPSPEMGILSPEELVAAVGKP